MALKHFDPAEDSREATFLAYEFLRRQPQEGLTLTAAALAAQTTLSQVAAEHALLALIVFWGTLFLGSITIIAHPLYPAFPTNLEADFDTLMSRGAGLWPALFLGPLFLVRIRHWRVKLSEWQRRMVGVVLLKQWRTTPQDHVLESEIPAQLLAEFGGTIDPEVSSTCVVFPEFERGVETEFSIELNLV